MFAVLLHHFVPGTDAYILVRKMFGERAAEDGIQHSVPDSFCPNPFCAFLLLLAPIRARPAAVQPNAVLVSWPEAFRDYYAKYCLDLRHTAVISVWLVAARDCVLLVYMYIYMS